MLPFFVYCFTYFKINFVLSQNLHFTCVQMLKGSLNLFYQCDVLKLSSCFVMSFVSTDLFQIAVTQPNCMKVLPLVKKENTHQVKFIIFFTCQLLSRNCFIEFMNCGLIIVFWSQSGSWCSVICVSPFVEQLIYHCYCAALLP